MSKGNGSSSERAHRTVPHTADLIIEAWAPGRAACLEETAEGLVEAFCDTGQVSATRSVPVAVDADNDVDLLVQFLEEIVYLVEVLGIVPVSASVEDTEDGGLAGFFEVAPVSEVEATGAVPKGVSHSDLQFSCEGGQWFCHAVVDV